VGLVEEVDKVLAAAAKLKGPAGNEANTKALLIEPMLAALGWDVTDVDHVVREWRVFDNTSLDYALKIDDGAALYVEAKGLKKSLDDKQFIAQTVNYANNDGVVWCVLTNGLTYRVYKTNEPVAMDQKLLFEVDLVDIAGGGAAAAAKSLQLLRRESLVNGELDLWGERVFTDTRVRKALSQLAADPPRGFLNAIEQAVGTPAVSRDRLKESLARVFDSQVGAIRDSIAGPESPKPRPPSNSPAKGRQEYSVAHHLDGKSASIIDLFEQMDEYGRSLGADVSRRVRKQYFGYFRGKRSFFTIEVQRQRVLLYVSLDPTAAKPWNDEAMRDVGEIGHFGMGDVEYSLRSAENVDEARELIKLAYHGPMSPGAS
jgi:predicted transport protein